MSEERYLAEIASLRNDLAKARREVKQVRLRNGIVRSLVEEMQAYISPIDPLPPVRQRATKKTVVEEHLVMHQSDEHADSVVEPHKVGGFEEYNFQVACCRAERYVEKVLEFTQNTLSNYRFPVLHLLWYGDSSSGEIHGAVAKSEYHNMLKNALAIGQMKALMVRDLAPHFERISVIGVSGNHGRRSVKKDYDGAHDNWDYAINEIAALHCKDIKNVSFSFPDCWSLNYAINGHGFNISHGDDIPSWNSIPFYGIERKTRRLVALHHSCGIQVKYFVMGHFHTLSTISDLKGETLINGAWIGTDPYAFERFSGYREPQQLIHGVHEKYGISWRLYVRLKDAEREKRGPERYHVRLHDS